LGSCLVESSKNNKLDGKKKTFQPSLMMKGGKIIAGWVRRVGMPPISFSPFLTLKIRYPAI